MNVRKLLAVAAASSALAAAPTVAQERGQVPAFRAFDCPSAAVENLDAWVERYSTAWADQDAMAVAALHARDTEWINAYGRQFQDAAELRAFLDQRLFPAFDPAISREEAAALRKVSYRCLAGGGAVVHLYGEGRRGPSRNAGEDVRRTHTHLVLNRQGDDWRVVHTAIMDVR